MKLVTALLAVVLVQLGLLSGYSFRYQSSKWHVKQHQYQVNFGLPASTKTDGDLVDISKKAFLREETKELNFDDGDVDCTSEGGTWSYMPFSEDQAIKFSEQITADADALDSSLKKAAAYNEDWEETFQILLESYPASAENAVKLCDRIDEVAGKFRANVILRFKRTLLMGELLRRDRDEYIAVASFLGNRIPRDELPNLQNVPYPVKGEAEAAGGKTSTADAASGVVADCTLPKVVYNENPLDKLLLFIFRKLVQKEINFKSDTPGILGLLEEGRHYKFTPVGMENDSVNQHIFVKNVLAGLLTPVLPPFYRIFMAGIIPSVERGDPEWLVNGSNKLIEIIPDALPFKKDLVPGRQFGPWFYAPFLTSAVTPPFLSFLLGPSRVNLRSDGQLGGMVVKKCKFLQESNCKGLCLHQCKLPAQQFFQDNLGVPLTVVPNFQTQECQWSWGEVPLPHTEDPDFPKGCITGCATRNLVEKAPMAPA